MGQWLKAAECGALPLGAAGYPPRARGTVYFAARGQFLSPKAFMLLWHQDREVGCIGNGQGVDWKGVDSGEGVSATPTEPLQSLLIDLVFPLISDINSRKRDWRDQTRKGLFL